MVEWFLLQFETLRAEYGRVTPLGGQHDDTQKDCSAWSEDCKVTKQVSESLSYLSELTSLGAFRCSWINQINLVILCQVTWQNSAYQACNVLLTFVKSARVLRYPQSVVDSIWFCRPQAHQLHMGVLRFTQHIMATLCQVASHVELALLRSRCWDHNLHHGQSRLRGHASISSLDRP